VIKVLILAYDFPPYVSVGGLRPFSWYKYFREFGVDPVVITRQWGNSYGNHLDYIAPGTSASEIIEESELGTIIRSPYHPNLSNRILLNKGERKWRFVRKANSAILEVAQFYIPVGPKIEVYYAANRYLKSNKVDLILATGDPFVLFHYANKLSKENNTPWIADYRDLWSHHKENTRTYFVKLWLKSLEKRIVSKAIYATTVSTFVQQKINEILPTLPMEIIPNGYDPYALHAVHDITPQNKVLRFAFVGTIYEWHPLELFLEQLHLFKSNNEISLEVNFYGTNKTAWIKEFIRSKYPSLIGTVNTYSKMPNQELLIMLASHHSMILFNDYSFLGTKIFDYLAIKRQIMLCFERDPVAEALRKRYFLIKETTNANAQLQADVLRKTNGGIVVTDAAHLQRVLASLQEEFLRTGNIACDSQDTEQYSRRIQVERLASLIKSISSQS
jgi:hypothetical protein